MQVEFGTGTLFASPQSGAPSLTPVPFGVSQDISVDISFTTKQLYGQNQFPVAIGRGEAKISCKAKAAQFSAVAFNGIFGGQAVAAGTLNGVVGEGPTPIPTTPFQITAVHTATFIDDLGVQNAANGQNFTKVAAGPVAGQYSVSAAGVYTFSSADQVSGISVLLNYTYTVAGSGFRTTVSNQAMGSAPVFTAVLTNSYQGNVFTLKLYAALSSKLSMGFKNTDFVVPEFDFEAFANAAGQVYDLSVTAN